MSHDGPKILTLDIETSPILAYTWGLFNQNLSLAQIVDPTRVICFAAKWAHEEDPMFWSEFHDGQEAMIQAAYDLLDEADVVITYNGNSFDLPHLEREFAEAGLLSPSPVQSIDLFRSIKQSMKFVSHKLAFITERFKLTGKMQHDGFELWLGCLAGDYRSWETMRDYNVQDVVTTEELYYEVLPFIKDHPSFTLYYDKNTALDEGVCPKCLTGDAVQKRGFAYTKRRKYQRYQCQDCGSWFRGTRSEHGVVIQ